MEQIETLLQTLLQKSPALTDIHLTDGAPIRIRLYGELCRTDIATPDIAAAFLPLLSEEKKKILQETGAADAAITACGRRFRVHLYHADGKLAAALRLLPDIGAFPKDPDENWMFHVKQFQTGLVLVTGPTGSGKTTTLAHILEDINENRACHVICVEDPAEYLYVSKKALIRQREIGRDVSDFAEGVRAAMREDPDVLVIGELRDSETMAAALTAAETGHLVLATLHDRSALEAIGRIVHSFPPEKEAEVRLTLAAVLRTVAAQVLWHHGEDTALLREILVNIPPVAHIIREGRDPQLIGYMEMGQKGMRTMKQAVDSYLAGAALSSEEAARLRSDIGL